MKYKNASGNTIFIQDEQINIPYDDQVREIDRNRIMRSPGFQQLILLGQIEVVEYGESRVEKNLKRMASSMARLKAITKGTRSQDPETPEVSEMPKDTSVVIKGHFLEGGGYAKCNRNLAFGLKEKGVNVKVDIVGNKKSELSAEDSRSLASLRGASGKHSIKIDSLIPSFGTMSSGRHTVLFTTIESYTVPKQFIDVANQYSEIWVVSDFCKEVLGKSGVNRPITVIPNSINTDLYTVEGDKYDFQPSLKKFVFVSVFGWSYRKGYDLLLKAYLKAFSGRDDVSLLLISKSQYGSNHIKKEVAKYIDEYGGDNPAHIVRCSKSIPEEEMPSLYRACDAFALFSRGEGFGLPYCEASLCGLPVIGTNCSGQSMFLNHGNSKLIDPDHYAKIPEGLMHVHYWDNQEFPTLTSDEMVECAAEAMRDVYLNKSLFIERNEKLRQFILSNYSIDEITNRVIEQLSKVG